MNNWAKSVSFYILSCHPSATANAITVPVVTPAAPDWPTIIGVPATTLTLDGPVTATVMLAGPHTVAVIGIIQSPHLQS